MHKPSGDLERLMSALKTATGHEALEIDLHLMRPLQPILRKGEWKVTAAIHRPHTGGTPRVVALWSGYFEGPVYGLAVDLGSTTIAGHLCDLSTGEVVASSGLMNPQIRFGEDLMSRVSYAMMNAGGDLEMTEAVRAGLNDLVEDIAKEAGAEKTQILDAVFVMNPVMHHLFLGIDPFELGQAPFALATSDAMQLSATDLGLNIAPGTRAYILPCIAGHVGADAAGVALSEAPNKSDDLALIVDVGTNAEILLGDKAGVLACSSPPGPRLKARRSHPGNAPPLGRLNGWKSIRSPKNRVFA